MNLYSRLGAAFICMLMMAGQSGFADTLLTDDFDGTIVPSEEWLIPAWRNLPDGTYLGRTQVRCTQNAALPCCIDGNVLIPLETRNPHGLSFYGTGLITKRAFEIGDGLEVTVRPNLARPSRRERWRDIFLRSEFGRRHAA